jgi:hypothetical protein
MSRPESAMFTLEQRAGERIGTLAVIMRLQSTKAIAAGGWILAMIAIGLVANLTSPSMWAVLALVAVIPPVVLWRFWNVPDQSMSESIRKALR